MAAARITRGLGMTSGSKGAYAENSIYHMAGKGS